MLNQRTLVKYNLPSLPTSQRTNDLGFVGHGLTQVVSKSLAIMPEPDCRLQALKGILPHYLLN
jgi:hypothetical protein